MEYIRQTIHSYKLYDIFTIPQSLRDKMVEVIILPIENIAEEESKREIQKGVKDFYDKTAKDWAETWYSDDTMLPLLKKFIGMFDATPRILDAGCGAGYESMRLANLGAEVVGIDISEESLNIARMENPNCRFELMDFKYIGDSLGVFDGIVSIGSIIHVENSDLQIVFDNFAGLTKSTGFLFIVFAEGDGYNEKKSIREIDGEKYNRATYHHLPERIIDVAHKAGFKYLDEWFIDEPFGQWRNFVFQKS
ncbi:MAG: class I SAM-dependent methyltransferase [Defluviitaleaceae bacterium]|nr:class I SAM-dependent methyltransferase [Defluviitaleaceae bacterium]